MGVAAKCWTRLNSIVTLVNGCGSLVYLSVIAPLCWREGSDQKGRFQMLLLDHTPWGHVYITRREGLLLHAIFYS